MGAGGSQSSRAFNKMESRKKMFLKMLAKARTGESDINSPYEHFECVEQFGFFRYRGEITESADFRIGERVVHKLGRRKIVDVEEEKAKQAFVSEDVKRVSSCTIHQWKTMNLREGKKMFIVGNGVRNDHIPD